jgi:fumarate hydratase class II
MDIPEEVYWGINTQRALQNFQISGLSFPPIFIRALAQVKKACLLANMELALIDENIGLVVLQALNELIENNQFIDQFQIDVFQQGSGTPTNMNMNEVIANRANEILGYPKGQKKPVHPNDHVNKSQSTNDVMPTALQIASLQIINEELYPAINIIKTSLDQLIKEFVDVIKVGRTHLQDAVPIPLALELKVYWQQIEDSKTRINRTCQELTYIPLGGTAVGTGIDAQPGFDQIVTQKLAEITNLTLKSHPIKAESIASHIAIVSVHSALRILAVNLLKMANDIRWMGSGPNAGLGELILPQNEPGSSIMPGKVNPTQCEMLIEVCLQVIGNDSIINSAETFGSNLDLNDCIPLMIYHFLESVHILSKGITSFSNNCLNNLQINRERIQDQLDHSPMLVTNLSPIIGYDKAAEIAINAIKMKKTIKETILDMGLNIPDLDELLNPKNMV